MSQIRGVYEMKCLSPEGFPQVYAVSSDNRMVVPPRAIYPFEQRQHVVNEVRKRLDQLDPPVSRQAA